LLPNLDQILLNETVLDKDVGSRSEFFSPFLFSGINQSTHYRTMSILETK